MNVSSYMFQNARFRQLRLGQLLRVWGKRQIVTSSTMHFVTLYLHLRLRRSQIIQPTTGCPGALSQGPIQRHGEGLPVHEWLLCFIMCLTGPAAWQYSGLMIQ
jgi:hypothetical protein